NFSVDWAMAGPRLRDAEAKLMMPSLIVSFVTPTSELKFSAAPPGRGAPGVAAAGAGAADPPVPPVPPDGTGDAGPVAPDPAAGPPPAAAFPLGAAAAPDGVG